MIKICCVRISLEICEWNVFGVPRMCLGGCDVRLIEYSLWVAILVEIPELLRHIITLKIAYWKSLNIGHAAARLRKSIVSIIYNTNHNWFAFFAHIMLWRRLIHGILKLCITILILIISLHLTVLRSSLNFSDLAVTDHICFIASCCHLAWEAA